MDLDEKILDLNVHIDRLIQALKVGFDFELDDLRDLEDDELKNEALDDLTRLQDRLGEAIEELDYLINKYSIDEG